MANFPRPVALLGDDGDGSGEKCRGVTLPLTRSEREDVVQRTKSGRFQKFNIVKNVEDNREQKQRFLVLQELLTSEQDYVRDLGYIVQGFLQPLRSIGVCGQEVPLIFGNIELLYR